MWSEDFERLTNESIDDRALEFTADVIVITSKDYKKFFQKLRKKLITLEELRIKIFKTYYKWINVWNSIKANKLLSYRKVDYSIEL